MLSRFGIVHFNTWSSAMRLCRFLNNGRVTVGLYDDKFVAPLAAVASAYANATHEKLELPGGDDLLDLLPPDGQAFAAGKKLAEWAARNDGGVPAAARLELDKVELLRPIQRPNKLLLLAGNYNEHITEGGGRATERAETFPYVFMKPPTTALTDPFKPVVIPRVSPNSIDWELELGVVIGRKARHVKEGDALAYVAGYTVVNDISDRKFRPNPGRKERPNDKWFDWEHGKWHDSFCPCGPCIASADAIGDPQKLAMRLHVSGSQKQNATTAQQIFPVAAVVAFISDIVTLEPGDVIATGTPSGVGNASGTYLKPGDRIEAWIEGIGTLVSPVVAEDDLRK
jgi:2-keto-4-pentenoate hydratase/2-oxohepta-3-ene-1,7-dioic acid hydratase in catechol pathway